MKQITKNMAMALVFVLALSACSTQQGIIDGKRPIGEPTYSGWSHYTFFGLGPDDEIDAAKICGGANKVQAVEGKQTFGNVMAAIFPGIFGIFWLPLTANVYCK